MEFNVQVRITFTADIRDVFAEYSSNITKAIVAGVIHPTRGLSIGIFQSLAQFRKLVRMAFMTSTYQTNPIYTT